MDTQALSQTYFTARKHNPNSGYNSGNIRVNTRRNENYDKYVLENGLKYSGNIRTKANLDTAYTLYPDIVSSLISIKDKNNNYMFSPRNIVSITNNAYLIERYPETFNIILEGIEARKNQKEISTNDAKIYIENLEEIDKHKKTFKKLLFTTNPETGKYTFTPQQILYFYDNKNIKQNFDIFNYLLTHEFKRGYLDSTSIIQLTNYSNDIKKHPDTFEYLMNLEDGDCPRFSATHVSSLISEIGNDIEEDPELFNQLLNCKSSPVPIKGMPYDYRFSAYSLIDLMDVKKEIKENPEFFNKMLNMQQENQFKTKYYSFDSFDLKQLMKHHNIVEKNPESFNYISNLKYNNGKSYAHRNIFSVTDNLLLCDVLDSGEKIPDEILSNEHIISRDSKAHIIRELLLTKKESPENYKKLLKQYSKIMSDKSSNNYNNISFYDGLAILTYNNKEILSIQNNGNTSKEDSETRYENCYAKVYSDKSTPKYNIEYLARYNPSNDYNHLYSYPQISIKTVKDKSGNLICKEYFIPSKKLKNKYEIITKDTNGNKYKTNSIEKSKKGNIFIKKNLKSENGIRTEYFYAESPKGNKINYTKIYDKEGNILLEHNYEFNRITKNGFQSIENDKVYDIKYYPDKVIVTKNKNESVELSIGAGKQIEPAMLPLCKQLPGSIYFDIAKGGLKSINNFYNEKMSAAYTTNNEIQFSQELSNHKHLFVLLHEIGHFKDYKNLNSLHEDKELLKIYKQERLNSLEQTTSQEQQAMDYFINSDNMFNINGLKEVIAETNALLYSRNQDKQVELRGEYLMKNYPETFAYIANKLILTE